MEPGGSNKQDGGVVNMTRAMEALSPWLNHPRRTIVTVEALVVATAALLLLQLILGCCKRRWRNSFIKYGLQVCAKLMDPLIIYTFGMMQSSPIKNASYPVWAGFLFMASMGTTTVYQYDFYDSKINQSVQYLVEFFRYMFYYGMLSLIGLGSENLRQARPIASSACVFSLVTFVLLTKLAECTALIFYRDPVPVQFRAPIRISADAGANADLRNSDPESMGGYDFVVLDRFMHTPLMLGHTFITIDQIWDSCENTDEGKKLKDLCLSYALSQQLLERRYFELPCTHQAYLVKERDFVFKKLLVEPSRRAFERAFRIIEVELGFCYDFFFTKYHSTFYSMESLFPPIHLFVLPKIILIVTVVVFALTKSLYLGRENPIIEVDSTDTDYITTVLVLIIALTVELVQTSFYLASDWVQVAVACRHVKKKWWLPNAVFGKASAFLRRFIISDGALKKKMDQYSFVFQEMDSVEVCDTVKDAIAWLISTFGNLTHAEITQRRQNQQFGTSMDHSQLEVVLIWHIATEYCSFADDRPQEDRGAAISLSRYCAYLIQFVPELAPYHLVDIRELSPEVFNELQATVRQEYVTGDVAVIYQRMHDTEGTDEVDNPTSVFKKGVKLGKQLERLSDRDLWVQLKDFWAETIIHVAASHNTTKQHMQHLETGGEFLTHIWALVSHAGIQDASRVPVMQEANLGSSAGPSEPQTEIMIQVDSWAASSSSSPPFRRKHVVL